MADRRKPKYKSGDTVKIVNPERWAYGCQAVVSGWFPTEKAAPYYLVKLIDSPNPYISTSYVTEDDLVKGEKS